MTNFTDSTSLKDASLEANDRYDILAQRARILVNDMVADGARPSEISYVLSYIAMELGICTADNNLWVFSTVLEGIRHAGNSAAEQADKRECVRKALEEDKATVQSGTEMH
ncbi:MAG: hypothetical protein QGG02_12165 [Gammaproteobacteria bacterium]|jgi:hypothetical protein|nr:hypothetical protein [Gammaproteobacteria bacterium]MDP6734346.1 hypothetical protein [Gammaproteobacteria bacterium]